MRHMPDLRAANGRGAGPAQPRPAALPDTAGTPTAHHRRAHVVNDGPDRLVPA